MVIDMNESRLISLKQLRAFLEGTVAVEFRPLKADEERYQHIVSVLQRFSYARLRRADKGLVLRYLMHTTGYSRQQLTRLVCQYRESGRLRKHYGAPAYGFTRKFTAADLALLAETDTLHGRLSGMATRRLFERALSVFGDMRYERLARISVSHLYNLRCSVGYRAKCVAWSKTQARPVASGVRKAPQPEGRPGFIRIDSVHQGDQDGVKGVYHINAIDCVTQWELVATCEAISEAFLLPVIEALLAGFPFVILGFHADNGSEYINHQVARLLAKLSIELSKSRPRHSNDNALAESKNGAVIRKHLGYAHIPQHLAAPVNAFCEEHLNPYLNFHRPCLFAEEMRDAKGKVRKRYPQKLVMTPFEKLASLPNAKRFLKPGVTFEQLNSEATGMTDNAAAARVNAARRRLFQLIECRRKHVA